MGANNSNLKQAVKDEYNRVQSSGAQYLVLTDLLRFNMPNLVHLQLTHMGVLFVMDSERDGRYTLEKLLAFFELAAEHARFYRAHEFQAQIQGYCALQLWDAVATPDGKAMFNNWFGKLVLESERRLRDAGGVEDHPGETFASRDTIQDLYEILDIKNNHGLDFQSFFDLLQRVGEEKGSMDLENEGLDDYAPIDTLQEFAASFVLGFREGLHLDALDA